MVKRLQLSSGVSPHSELLHVEPLYIGCRIGNRSRDGRCREATPPEASAHYTLRSVDGQSLPAVVFQGSGSTLWVTRGEATLGPGDSFLLVVRDSSDSPLLPEPAETDSLAGRYRVADAGPTDRRRD